MFKINKLFICLILVLSFLSANCTLAKGRSTDFKMQEASDKAVAESNMHFQNVVLKILRNFKDDSNFTRNFSSTCYNFQRMRYAEVDAVYRTIDNKVEDYNYYYPKLYSDYFIKMNNDELVKYKYMLTKYCVYGKYYQKDPNACSAERIDSLFR